MTEKAGHGMHLLTSISRKAISLVGFAFVDDTDLFLAGRVTDTVGEHMVPDFQSALDRWAGGLITTGGALTLIKSFAT